MRSSAAFTLAPLALVSLLAVPCSAFSVDYLTAEQAQKTLFPAAASWREKSVNLSADQLLALRRQAGVPARSAAWRLQQALDVKGNVLGTVVVDHVIGKFELITYAVGIDAKGQIAGIEILSYRESHGSEIRLPAWRKQFLGKDSKAALKTGEDIAIISGATMSCSHVTEGVRRIVSLVAMLGEQS
jgi:Na+-translocating ferredoxin:NAD+ oxidoreductase RnfG subunit